MDLRDSTIWQWNARSISSKVPELSHLLQIHKTPVLAISETGAIGSAINGYTDHHSEFRNGRIHASIYVRNDIPHVQINTASQYEGIDICLISLKAKVQLHICSVYIDATKNWNPSILINLANSYNNLLILGDFNAHSISWGSDKEVRSGAVHQLLNDSDLVLLNDGSHTYFRGSYSSAIDLSMVSANIASSFDWSTSTERLSSDHCLVIIKTNLLSSNNPSKRIFHTNWAHFSELMSSRSESNNTYSLLLKIRECIHHSTIKREVISGCHSYPVSINKLLAKRRILYNRYRRSGDISIGIELKRISALLKRTINRDRRESWRRFCDQLNHRSLDSTVWSRITMLYRKNKSTKSSWLPLLAIHQSPQKIADLFYDHFYPSTSSTSHNVIFDHSSVQRLPKNDCVDLNSPFNKWELKRALSRSSTKSSPGPDGIPYKALAVMADSDELLNNLNRVWIHNLFPDEWRNSTIFPLLKKSKSPLQLSSYRLIALSSCLLKTLERMIAFRLSSLLEAQHFFPKEQTGFRRRRQTSWNLIDLVSSAEEANLTSKNTIAVFFDMARAFDTVNHRVILSKLSSMGIHGRLLLFISNYLTLRTVSLKLGSFTANPRPVVCGVPQGGVLSPILFNILMQSLPQYIPSPIRCSIFADDVAIWLSGGSPAKANLLLQKAIDGISLFASNHDLTISAEKTVMLPICRSRTIANKIKLQLESSNLQIVSSHKFLGVRIDKNLTFSQHFKELKAESSQRLNMLKCLAGTYWGSSASRLSTFYKALIRSKLLYGNEVALLASKTTFNILDTIQSQALRYISGTPKSSSNQKICNLLKFPSIKQILQFNLESVLVKIKHRQQDHPILTRLNRLANTGVLASAFRNINSSRIPTETPPLLQWTLARPRLLLPSFQKKHFVNIGNNPCAKIACQWIEALSHSTDMSIFTDGSFDVDNQIGGAAFFINNEFKGSFHIPTCYSSTEAELTAIAEALFALQNHSGNLTIFSDSKTALLSIDNPDVVQENSIVRQIVLLVHQRFVDYLSRVTFSWIPSHVGIAPNEQADILAKEGLLVTSHPTRYQNNSIAPILRLMKNRHLHDHSIPWNKCSRSTETLFCRLFVGRIFTRELLFHWGKSATPVCPSCNSGITETTQHLLWECPLRSSSTFYRKLASIGLPTPICTQDLARIEDNKSTQAKKMKLIMEHLSERFQLSRL